ncbi:MAG: DUF4129 domain-containing protein [Thermoguttaceae bacterium]
MMLAVLDLARTLLAQTSPPDDPVAAGRDALSQWGRYPWYDGETDGLRPVEIVEPWDLSWLWNWLRWNGNLGNLSGNWIQWFFWSLILAVLALLTWYLVRAFLKRDGTAETLLDGQAESPEEERRRIEALPEPVRQRTRLLEAAERCYRDGNFDEAIIYLFSHQLVCLDRNYLIRLGRGKTNRQYLRELGARDTLRRILAETIVAFEDVFFGGRSIGRERFEACWDRRGQFEVLAAGGAGR